MDSEGGVFRIYTEFDAPSLRLERTGNHECPAVSVAVTRGPTSMQLEFQGDPKFPLRFQFQLAADLSELSGEAAGTRRGGGGKGGEAHVLGVGSGGCAGALARQRSARVREAGWPCIVHAAAS